MSLLDDHFHDFPPETLYKYARVAVLAVNTLSNQEEGESKHAMGRASEILQNMLRIQTNSFAITMVFILSW